MITEPTKHGIYIATQKMEYLLFFVLCILFGEVSPGGITGGRQF